MLGTNQLLQYTETFSNRITSLFHVGGESLHTITVFLVKFVHLFNKSLLIARSSLAHESICASIGSFLFIFVCLVSTQLDV